MRRTILILAVLFAAFAATAQSSSQKSMLDTFVKYASIDSQSDNDNPWPCTPGQLDMARAIQDDVSQAIEKSKAKGATVEVSKDGYVYVRIPANIKTKCPSLGVSCHLDVTPEAKGAKSSPSWTR